MSETRLNIEWLRSEAKSHNAVGDVAKAVRLAESASQIERLQEFIHNVTKMMPWCSRCGISGVTIATNGEYVACKCNHEVSDE